MGFVRATCSQLRICIQFVWQNGIKLKVHFPAHNPFVLEFVQSYSYSTHSFDGFQCETKFVYSLDSSAQE